MSRTVSARISNDRHEKIREHCNNLGCTIDEFLKACIEQMLTGSSDFDFWAGTGCPPYDPHTWEKTSNKTEEETKEPIAAKETSDTQEEEKSTERVTRRVKVIV